MVFYESHPTDRATTMLRQAAAEHYGVPVAQVTTGMLMAEAARLIALATNPPPTFWADAEPDVRDANLPRDLLTTDLDEREELVDRCALYYGKARTAVTEEILREFAGLEAAGKAVRRD